MSPPGIKDLDLKLLFFHLDFFVNYERDVHGYYHVNRMIGQRSLNLLLQCLPLISTLTHRFGFGSR